MKHELNLRFRVYISIAQYSSNQNYSLDLVRTLYLSNNTYYLLFYSEELSIVNGYLDAEAEYTFHVFDRCFYNKWYKWKIIWYSSSKSLALGTYTDLEVHK